MHRKYILVLLWVGMLFSFAARLSAQSGASAHQIFLPVTGHRMATDSISQQPPTTPTAPATATSTPIATPTVTPTATAIPTTTVIATPTPGPAELDADLFVTTTWKTSSASVQVDTNGGLHMGYYFYEPQDGTAPNHAVYRHCASQCGNSANWQEVALLPDRDVREVQLELTSGGQPRLLMVAASTVYTGGKDYLYAACDQQCIDPTSWATTLVLSSDGTSIFDTSDDNTPQRSFALDPQDRPRFIYQDRNYFWIEPDHYGAFYVYCDANCTDHNTANPTWFQTQISDEVRDGFRYDYEVFEYPALTFTRQGGPRVITNILALPGAVSGIYYLGCDSGCEQRANWQRQYLIDRGSYVDVSWDLELDSQERPRVAYAKGQGGDSGEKLYYLYCNVNCLTSADGWQYNEKFVVAQAKHPDLELDSQGRPRIAFVDSNSNLAYGWCDTECENSGSWQQRVLEDTGYLNQRWPVAKPAGCDAGLWHMLTPVLALDSQGAPRLALDATYHARCWYDPNPSDGEPATYNFHLIVRTVQGLFIPQPK